MDTGSHLDYLRFYQIVLSCVLLLIFADIDECQVSNTTCINADCVNEVGGYFCGPCYLGFEREIPNSNLTACGKKSLSLVIK